MNQRTGIALMVGCALGTLVALALWAGHRSPPAFYLGGIQVNEPDHAVWTEALTEVGMNTVPVTVYAKQGDWDSDNLWWEDQEPYVINEIRASRRAGLQVVLILRVALDSAFPRNRFLWHGMIMPGDDAALDAWFDKYAAFVEKWAAIAEAEGVEVLGIGSEMNALTDTVPRSRADFDKEYAYLQYWHNHYKTRVMEFSEAIEARHLWMEGGGAADLEVYLTEREAAQLTWLDRQYLPAAAGEPPPIQVRQWRLERGWRRVIERARRVYSGKLIYASNFDAYHKVAFWDALDVMGVNAYFKLRESFDTPLTDEEMLAAFTERWKVIFGDLEAFRAGRGIGDRPLFFTELGYTIRKNSTFEPWSYTAFSIIEWDHNGTTELQRHLVVWQDQPVDYRERRIAIDALYAATRSEQRGYFRGILFWKFSTNPEHTSIEPFVMHVGPDSKDALQGSLLRFVREPWSAPER